VNHHTINSPCPLCEEKLALADPELIDWFHNEVKPAYPSCHVSWAYRNRVDQELAFLDGKTKLHYPLSAHNKEPALALDLFQLDNGGNAIWDHDIFAALHAINAVKYTHIIWGGLWKSIGDADHFEFVPTESKPEEVV
jgi:hypothetical protein